MTAVVLTSIWLNDAEDPSDFCEIAYAGDAWDAESQVPGRVAEYAGRLRAIVTGAKRTGVQFPVEFGRDRAVVDWLESHLARKLWLRDPRGRKVSGIIWSLPTREDTFDDGPGSAATVTFQPVSASESV